MRYRLNVAEKAKRKIEKANKLFENNIKEKQEKVHVKEKTPATDKQIERLESLGVNTSELTHAQAWSLINIYYSRRDDQTTLVVKIADLIYEHNKECILKKKYRYAST